MLGILDDLIILPALIWLAVKVIPVKVMHDARIRTEVRTAPPSTSLKHQACRCTRVQVEPLRLSRNWFTACFIFAMWLALAEWLAWFLVTSYGTPLLQTPPYLYGLMGGLGAVLVAVFGTWMCLMLRKEKRRAARAQEVGGLGTARQEGGKEGGGEGITEPLL